jgi:hypothetical protein
MIPEVAIVAKLILAPKHNTMKVYNVNIGNASRTSHFLV